MSAINTLNVMAVSAGAIWQTLGRMHVAVVHFPIGLLVIAGMIEGYRVIVRKKGSSTVAGTFLLLGAIAAVASAGMGWLLKADSEPSALLVRHQWFGIATAIAAIVAASLAPVARRVPKTTGLYRVWVGVVLALVCLTGHFGGSLTHGETYLTELLWPVGEIANVVAVAGPKKVDFVRDVQPILQNSCYDCHAGNKRKGGLRLDSRPLVMKGGGSGPTVVPGDASHSLLLQYVTGAGGKKRMPLNKDPLKPEEIAILKAWVEQGAIWPDAVANEKAAEKHWAFIKPVAPAVPKVQQAEWVKNPIDAFVLAGMEKEGLKPSPEADRRTLIRRASLDLIGLPPTPAEVDAFLNDASPDAYEKVVDRLLASVHYGERWGRHWLDIARYADTNGYEKDNTRTIWPYRDWVINAINRDLPYDQFVIEQLAGDMLPNATAEQKIATGFHRNTMFNEEGGIDVEEFRFKAMVDRVQTTSTAFLGLTMQCCQCHDHKYDPISQKEYYSFFALLNNADEPKLNVPDEKVTEKREEKQAKIDQLIATLDQRFPTHKPAVEYTPSKPSSAIATNGSILTIGSDGSVKAMGKKIEKDSYQLTIPVASLKDVTDLKIEVLTDKPFPKKGPGRAKNGNLVLSEVKVEAFPASAATTKPGTGTALILESPTADIEQPNFPAAAAIDGNPETGWALDGAGILNANHWIAFKIKETPALTPATLVVTLDQNFPEHLIGKMRISLGKAQAIPNSNLPIAERRAKFLESEMAAWEADAKAKCVAWTVLDPAKFSRIHDGTIRKLADHSLLFTGDNYYREQYDIECPTDLKNVTAIRLDVLPDDRLENGGPGRDPNGGFLVSEFTTSVLPKPTTLVDASEHAGATSQPSAAPLTFGTAVANAGMGIEKAIDGKHDTHWIDFTPQGQARSAIFRLKEKLANPAGSVLQIGITQNYHQQENLGRVLLSVTSDPRADLDDSTIPLEISRILLKPTDQRSEEETKALKAHFLSVTPLMAEERAKIAAIKASMPKYVTTLVMQDRPVMRPTQIHHRGEFAQPTDPVEGGIPEILPQLPKDQPANRLTLARWLVSDDNPLIGRVTMNRVWNTFFGRGIVPTVEDFGTVGERPSNPELLDYLATELPRRKWSMKAMHRLIVTSATYRQSSKVSPALLAKDPQNVFLARGPRFRVDAEIVRDIALKTSGLLSEKVGGPSVFPPQPDGVSELSYGPITWKTSEGEDRYRRGLYTFFKRTSIYPELTTFDSPTSEVVCPRRSRSNTPLQALTTLNDTVFVEASQAMGKKLVADQTTTTDRVKEAFELCLARPPEADELAEVSAFYQSQIGRFRAKQADAAKVAMINPAKMPTGTDVNELAAWTTVARAILNLDETVTKE